MSKEMKEKQEKLCQFLDIGFISLSTFLKLYLELKYPDTSES